MPRTARKKSESGIYHVMLRGINRQEILSDEEDNVKFLEILSECKKISGFELYGYCLMRNHLHLLIREGKEELGHIFRRIGTRYAYWYNRKYNRVGHLFQDRFKSEPVDDEGYYLTVLRYIHQNPVRAGLCKTLDGYKWSSYGDYVGKQGITDINFTLELISMEDFIKYMNEETREKCIDYESGKKELPDKELARILAEKYKMPPTKLKDEPREKLRIMLREILELEGVSTRQLARLTGISPNIIWKSGSRGTVPLLPE